MPSDAHVESNALDAEHSITFPSREAGEQFVRTLRDNAGFCYWCLAPIIVNPVVEFTNEGPRDTLRTTETFQQHGHPVEDVPPDRTDESGQIVETSRDEQTICGSCGVIDVDAKESRTKETTRQALHHVVSILEENGVDVSLPVAVEAVSEAFAERRTGQFVRTLGNAIYQATE